MTGIISSFTGVWSDISDWIVDFIPKMVSIYYNTESGLTFLGTLSVVALGISVFFLIMGLIQNHLHLRG